MKDIEELEFELMKTMTALVVRYPDGIERIQAAFESIVEAGIQMKTKNSFYH